MECPRSLTVDEIYRTLNKRAFFYKNKSSVFVEALAHEMFVLSPSQSSTQPQGSHRRRKSQMKGGSVLAGVQWPIYDFYTVFKKTNCRKTYFIIKCLTKCKNNHHKLLLSLQDQIVLTKCSFSN